MIRYLKIDSGQAGADEPVFIMRIFEQQRTRRAMIALFLAVLEMVRLQAIVVTAEGSVRRDRAEAAREDSKRCLPPTSR